MIASEVSAGEDSKLREVMTACLLSARVSDHCLNLNVTPSFFSLKLAYQFQSPVPSLVFQAEPVRLLYYTVQCSVPALRGLH